MEVKQRNRRRRRAQRMQAQREGKADRRDGPDSGDDDENVVREKPQRPHNRRKKNKEPLVEEDIVEGFSILQFRSYEDLEVSTPKGVLHIQNGTPNRFHFIEQRSTKTTSSNQWGHSLSHYFFSYLMFCKSS